MSDVETVVKSVDIAGQVLTLSIICGENPRARVSGCYHHIYPDLAIGVNTLCNDYPLSFSDSFEHASESLDKWVKISRQNHKLTIDREARLG